MKKALSFVLALVLTLTTGCAPAMQNEQNAPKAEVNPLSAHRLAEAVYPEMASCPNEMEYIDEETGELDDRGYMRDYEAWRKDQIRKRPEEGYADNLKGFFEKSIPQFFQNCNALFYCTFGCNRL